MLQQWGLCCLFGVGFEDVLLVFGWQLDFQCVVGVLVGVVGVGGEESVVIDVVILLGELGVWVGYLYQVQVIVLYDQVQVVVNLWFVVGQCWIGDVQWQQLVGGLFDVVVGIFQQIIEIVQVGSGWVIGQVQVYVVCVCWQLQWVVCCCQVEVLYLFYLLVVGQQVEVYCQVVVDLFVLVQFGVLVVIVEWLLCQWNVVDFFGQFQGLVVLVVRWFVEQFGFDWLFVLVEDEQVEVGLVILVEVSWFVLFQVQWFF